MSNLRKYEKLLHILCALYVVFAFGVMLINPILYPKRYILEECNPEVNSLRASKKWKNEHKILIASK